MKRIICLLIMILLLSTTFVSAATRVQKLNDNRFLITLKKWTGWGGEGRVLRQLNIKSASLCVVAGYQWFEVVDQTSHGRGFVKTAAGTYQVKFHNEQQHDEMLSCEALATDEEKRKMQRILAKAK